MPGAATSDLKPIVQEWFQRALPVIRTKEWEETWIDFRIAWSEVKKPFGATMASIVATAKAKMPVDADSIERMTVLCREMQEKHGRGQAFCLSCRVAAASIGIGHTKAASILKLLCREGVLERVAEGGIKGSKKAAEYRLNRGRTGGK